MTIPKGCWAWIVASAVRAWTWLRAARVATAALAVAGLLLSGGCLLEKYCDSDDQCRGNAVCDLATNRCVPAPPDDGGLPDGGDASSPECSNSSECLNPSAPICDTAGLECRGCGDHGECAERSQLTPVCVAPACVQCTDSADHCVELTPICDATDLECRGCADHDECAARNADTPVCAGPACVGCTDSVLHCAGTAPVCDATDLACRECTGHDECALLAGGVCDWSSGACLDATDIIYVDDDICPEVGEGTDASPFCSIQQAVSSLSPVRTTILVAEGTYDSFIADDIGPAWIVGAGPSVVFTPSLNNTSVVYVTASTDLTLENVAVQGAGGSGSGVECEGSIQIQPVVTLLRSEVSSNSGEGVRAMYCTMNLDSNVVRFNAGGGVSLNTCGFVVTNNFIVRNGAHGSTYGGMLIALPVAGYELWNNTIASSLNDEVEPSGIWCLSTVDVGNTIVHGNHGTDMSASCNPVNCWTTADGTPLFVGGGDYHLQPGSPCVDQGDPAFALDHDIDGELRPQGDGPDIGADEVQ